ncbi:hypothetical protein Tsubulata_037466 [Turnera subulata]|uniref:C3H1-type domain-containing protein n=1 Tax=Turnera subulata TaxID=218843 RepID=A0A9Q0FV79_9ROSI|nr:hypothetical protein Tsubulata_037466 [Turnera subulata]
MDARKRARADAGGFNLNGGFKKSKQEMDSLSTGVGSKSKPCTKFYSIAGCPFGESCHFQHYVPGGYNAVAQMMNLGPQVTPPSRNLAAPPAVTNGSAPPAVKSRLCNKYNTAEGCKFGDKCHFAHGDLDIGKPVLPSLNDPRGTGPVPERINSWIEPAPAHPLANFGVSATTKISVDASLAGAIIGKGGVIAKQIYRQSGAKLSIREHETDPNLRNIELEGSFEQINQASTMVKELILSLGSSYAPAQNVGGAGGHAHPKSNYKTKICDNFTKGSCTFGQKCHFAHGAAELRKLGLGV